MAYRPHRPLTLHLQYLIELMQNRFLRRFVWFAIIAAIIVTLILFLGSLLNSKKPAAPANTAATSSALAFTREEIMQVTAVELKQTLALSGSLRAVEQASVKARVAGDVREVMAREGEAVKAGQILVRMDTTEYQAKVDQARGNLNAARAQMDIAIKNRDNNRALLDKGFISRAAFDNTASQLAVAQANVDAARGALDVIQKLLNDTVIRAPISGLIASRNIQPGEKISVDYRLFDLVNLKKMEMEAAVPANEISRIKLSQKVSLHVEGMPETFTGQVTRINPGTQTGSRSILVYIQVSNPLDLLRMGMFAEAQLTLQTKTDVIALPMSAVRKDSNGAYVYAIEAGKLIKKPVTLGMEGRSDEEPRVEIISGLRLNDQIIKNDMGNLRPGTAVHIAQQADKK